MPIAVTCSGCDKRYQVKDEFAGKKIRCPQCQAVVTIGQPQTSAVKKGTAAAKADEYEDYPDDIEEYGDDDDYFDEPRVLNVPPRNKVKKKKSSKPKREKKVRHREPSESNWGIIFSVVIIGGLLTSFVSIFIYPQATNPLLVTVFLVGWGLTIVGNIGLIVRAFQEDVVCGILFLFVPGYGLYYLASRWDDNQPFGGFFLGGFATVILVFAIISVIISHTHSRRGGPRRFGAQPRALLIVEQIPSVNQRPLPVFGG